MTPIREEVAKNLLYFRKKSGLSQKEFAEKLGVRNSTVSTWENGKNSIDIETLFRACDILHVTIYDMYGKYADSTVQEYTVHEREVIAAYRANPAMQSAVDKLLGVQDSATTVGEDIASTISAALEKTSVRK